MPLSDWDEWDAVRKELLQKAAQGALIRLNPERDDSIGDDSADPSDNFRCTHCGEEWQLYEPWKEGRGRLQTRRSAMREWLPQPAAATGGSRPDRLWSLYWIWALLAAVFLLFRLIFR